MLTNAHDPEATVAKFLVLREILTLAERTNKVSSCSVVPFRVSFMGAVFHCWMSSKTLQPRLNVSDACETCKRTVHPGCLVINLNGLSLETPIQYWIEAIDKFIEFTEQHAIAGSTVKEGAIALLEMHKEDAEEEIEKHKLLFLGNP